ncbi:DUF4685 domain-containing protein [Cellulosimicrobium marinum]|uniref:DUF4685 domain-containing protein n=1 Tax=Cellulosimicrobium marinum TaxID=1638992 RepID=UPI001E4A146C|nr:DUF4685 domain-containing protein [Cellulosimicrobium marinum]MCB7136161.1 DUF4685 domain-containing protein [Cellulosimicrobium marinum]
MARAARIAAYRTVSATLARYGDDEVRDLLDAAEPAGWGIGGRTLRTVVDGVPVFVKHVRLTDLERRPENVGSTANLFGLPMSCHYGVGTLGGPGFGAWREVAVHAATTGWVLAGDHDGFPLTYHRRVLPDGGAALERSTAGGSASPTTGSPSPTGSTSRPTRRASPPRTATTTAGSSPPTS